MVSLLGAAPTKGAALTTHLLLAAAALLVTGTFDLALASGSWGTGAAIAVGRSGVLAAVEARDQAAVKLQVSFVLLLQLYRAHQCVAGTYLIKKAETVDSALVDKIGPNDGDAKLTSQFHIQT